MPETSRHEPSDPKRSETGVIRSKKVKAVALEVTERNVDEFLSQSDGRKQESNESRNRRYDRGLGRTARSQEVSKVS